MRPRQRVVKSGVSNQPLDTPYTSVMYSKMEILGRDLTPTSVSL